MNPAPIAPATVELEQERRVFLAGNGLPERWRGRDRFVVLELGFGLGHNLFATWRAWLDDAERCERLTFIAIDAHPPTRETLRSLQRDGGDPGITALADELVAAWPPLVFGLHRLVFAQGRVELLLAFGDAAAWLPQLHARVDAFHLDGSAPARNPAMWQPRLFKAMARLAAPGATVAAWTAALAVRDSLRAAGFEARLAAGRNGKRDITLASHAPHESQRTPAALRGALPAAPRDDSSDAVPPLRIVVIGAGLAGCATARALADQGLACIVVDADDVASGASGNAAGVFHGIVHAADGRHARWHRAAALAARAAVAELVAADGAAAGSVSGLLRLVPGAASAAELEAVAQRLGLPGDYACALSPEAASAHAGIAIESPAWFLPGGGWVDPGALARHQLTRAGRFATLRRSERIAVLLRDGNAWRLLDAAGREIERADVVVVAAGMASAQLIGSLPTALEAARGQSSVATTASPLPRVPVVGSGYAVAIGPGRLAFGATSQPGDTGLDVRDADHESNVERLRGLVGALPADLAIVAGRAGVRAVSADRLPWIGAVPDPSAPLSSRPEQPRHAARLPGLFVVTALGSRGIASASLGGAVVAALIAGAPVPVEADLLDAVDPARFASRAWRRAGRSAVPG